MPRTTVNFAEVEGMDAVPKGDYECVISDATWREATEEGKSDYINLEATVTEAGEYKDRKFWSVLSFSPKALWRMKETLENLGIIEPDDEIEFDYDEDTMKVTEPELIGIPCLVTVSTRLYEGREQNQVDNITSLDSSPAKKTAPGKKAPSSAAKAPAAAKKPAGTSRRKFQ